MKPVYITFTDAQGTTTNTFTTCSLKTGMMDTIFDIAEQAEQLKSGKSDIKQSRQFFKDLKALIVAIFGGQFSYDELNEGAEQSEIMRVFNDICSKISGDMRKN
ncbi:phage tail assembly chaperone G [Paenibacillus sp. HJGM_3]|uniref:phage tail assembly chaperone G n=1 Tax=Paenibacillus sp. HJGM_3 TaxID=3379816 RepID=UPI00385BE65E